jgi:hypothetical protein
MDKLLYPHSTSTTRLARSSERPNGRVFTNRDPKNQNQIFVGGVKNFLFQHPKNLIGFE